MGIMGDAMWTVAILAFLFSYGGYRALPRRRALHGAGCNCDRCVTSRVSATDEQKRAIDRLVDARGRRDRLVSQ